MRTHEQLMPPCFVELAAAVPPMLELAVGYPLGAKPPDGPHYLGLCWQRAGDEAWFEDGRYGSCANASGYLAWIRHAAVGPYLPAGCHAGNTYTGEHRDPVDLGSGDTEPTHMLVLDRAARKVHVAPYDAARAFLKGQWTILDPRNNADVERLGRDADACATKLLDGMFRGLGGVPTPEQVREVRAAEQLLLVDMARWLDRTDQARAARARIRDAAGGVVDGWRPPANPNEGMGDFLKCETDA